MLFIIWVYLGCAGGYYHHVQLHTPPSRRCCIYTRSCLPYKPQSHGVCTLSDLSNPGQNITFITSSNQRSKPNKSVSASPAFHNLHAPSPPPTQTPLSCSLSLYLAIHTFLPYTLTLSEIMKLIASLSSSDHIYVVKGQKSEMDEVISGCLVGHHHSFTLRCVLH